MRVLVVQAGSYSGPRARLGDYDAWFSELLREAGADAAIWRARDEPPPADRPAAAVITGSSASMTRTEPWIERLCDWARSMEARGVPLLGVCFGHQMLAQAFGGRVERHPAGREVGTIELELTELGAADPLFEGVPRRFRANATHGDHVAALPPGARVLARNALVPVQAFALGPRVRGVQFHPEYTAERLRAYALDNAAFLEKEAGPCAAERVLETAADTPEARSILANFVRHYANR